MQKKLLETLADTIRGGGRWLVVAMVLGAAAATGQAQVIFTDTFDSGTGAWYKGGTAGTLSNVSGELSWAPGSTDDTRNNIGRSFSATTVGVGETLRLTFTLRKVGSSSDIFRLGLYHTTNPIEADNWVSAIGTYSGFWSFMRDNSTSTHIARYQTATTGSTTAGPLHTNGNTDIGNSNTQFNINDDGTVTYQVLFEIKRVSAEQIDTLYTLSSGSTTDISVSGTTSTSAHMMSEFNTVAWRGRYATMFLDNIQLEIIRPVSVNMSVYDGATLVNTNDTVNLGLLLIDASTNRTLTVTNAVLASEDLLLTNSPNAVVFATRIPIPLMFRSRRWPRPRG